MSVILDGYYGDEALLPRRSWSTSRTRFHDIRHGSCEFGVWMNDDSAILQ